MTTKSLSVGPIPSVQAGTGILYGELSGYKFVFSDNFYWTSSLA